MTRSECNCYWKKKKKMFWTSFANLVTKDVPFIALTFFLMTWGFIFEWKRVDWTMRQTFSQSGYDSLNRTVEFLVNFAIQNSIFRIWRLGRFPLLIATIKPENKCTTLDIPSNEIASNERSLIRARYRPLQRAADQPLFPHYYGIRRARIRNSS